LLRKISEEKGFRLVVLGKEVHVKVWIHFFIGDTEGNNKWSGQYPGNKEGVQRPYHDCKCTWQMLSHINPNCEYLSLKDEWIAKKRKHSDDDGGKNIISPCPNMTSRIHLLRDILPSQTVFMVHSR